jgi:hypothetical protein
MIIPESRKVLFITTGLKHKITENKQDKPQVYKSRFLAFTTGRVTLGNDVILLLLKGSITWYIKINLT